MDDGETPKCGTCGFLSLRSISIPGADPRPFLEVDELVRKNPKLATGLGQGQKAELQCYQRSPEFPVADISHAGLQTWPEQKLLGILYESRACSKWYLHEIGFSPKDHLMHQRLSNLEEDRRRFATALNNSGRWLILAALIVGLLQLTKDSLVFKALVDLGAYFAARIR